MATRHTEHFKEVWIVAEQQSNTRITMGTSEPCDWKQKKPHMPGDFSYMVQSLPLMMSGNL